MEAHPPSESVTFLTVDLLLEPGGGVSVLSCGDQLYGSCQLEAVGSAVPQTSVQPETLHSFCIRVGRACQHYFSAGYVSVGLATFTDLNTTEQKVRLRQSWMTNMIGVPPADVSRLLHLYWWEKNQF